MKRLLLAVVILAACSGGDGTPDVVKDWPDAERITFEGEPLWYSQEQRMVYGETCAITDAATRTVGLEFSGYGQTCPNPAYGQ